MSSTTPIITVAFDGSEDSRRAAAWAVAAARERPGTSVHLVHALTLPPIPSVFPEITVDQLFANHEREIRDALEREQLGGVSSGVEIEGLVRRWFPVETVLDHVRETGSELIVVGQRGARATRLLLGSVSSALARAAEVPTVVVRGARGAVPPRTVLLAFDGSAASGRAAAAAYRWFPNAKFVALAVRDGEAPADEPTLRQSLQRLSIEAAESELRVLDGPVAETLLDVAESERFDLVAAGRRGLSRWSELLLGAVSERLVQLAPCPVLLAH